MTKRMAAVLPVSSFVIRASSLIRHSGFVIRISLVAPVQVPLERFEHAEDPPPPARVVFDVEVVAGLVVAEPPGAGEAFGADGVDDAVGFAAIDGEGDRGAVAV